MTDRGWILAEEEIERVLLAMLENIRTAVADDTIATLVDRMFFNLSDTRKARVVTWLETDPITVVHGWPIESQRLPCWAIIAGPGQEVMQYVGQFDEEVDLDGVHYQGHAERWSGRVGIVSHSENGDDVRYMTQLALWALARGRRDLASTFTFTQSGQYSDMEPARTESGRLLHRRAASISLEWHQRAVAIEDSTNITDFLGTPASASPGDADF